AIISPRRGNPRQRFVGGGSGGNGWGGHVGHGASICRCGTVPRHDCEPITMHPGASGAMLRYTQPGPWQLARKPNYDFEKRRKEQERQKKKEAKREERLQRKQAEGEGGGGGE